MGQIIGVVIHATTKSVVCMCWRIWNHSLGSFFEPYPLKTIPFSTVFTIDYWQMPKFLSRGTSHQSSLDKAEKVGNKARTWRKTSNCCGHWKRGPSPTPSSFLPKSGPKSVDHSRSSLFHMLWICFNVPPATAGHPGHLAIRHRVAASCEENCVTLQRIERPATRVLARFLDGQIEILLVMMIDDW